jgi:hypothetical protein
MKCANRRSDLDEAYPCYRAVLFPYAADASVALQGAFPSHGFCAIGADLPEAMRAPRPMVVCHRPAFRLRCGARPDLL